MLGHVALQGVEASDGRRILRHREVREQDELARCGPGVASERGSGRGRSVAQPIQPSSSSSARAASRRRQPVGSAESVIGSAISRHPMRAIKRRTRSVTGSFSDRHDQDSGRPRRRFRDRLVRMARSIARQKVFQSFSGDRPHGRYRRRNWRASVRVRPGTSSRLIASRARFWTRRRRGDRVPQAHADEVDQAEPILPVDRISADQDVGRLEVSMGQRPLVQ